MQYNYNKFSGIIKKEFKFPEHFVSKIQSTSKQANRNKINGRSKQGTDVLFSRPNLIHSSVVSVPYHVRLRTDSLIDM